MRTDMPPLPDDRQALHRENQRVGAHLTKLAALKTRRGRDTTTETPPPSAGLTRTIPVPGLVPTLPEPEKTVEGSANGFFDDFETDTKPIRSTAPPPEDGFMFGDDSTAPGKPDQDTGRLAASAEETSDELRRPEAAPEGESINDVLDGFNW